MDDDIREQLLTGDPHVSINTDPYMHGDIPECYVNEILVNQVDNGEYRAPDISSSKSNGIEGRLERARSRYLTVELPLVFMALVMSIVSTMRPEYLRERIAVDEYHYNLTVNHSGSKCDANQSAIDHEIQATTSTWMFYLGMIQSIPGLFMVVFLGSLSDRMGRKPAICLCTFGYIVNIIGNILVIYFHFPILAFIPGDLINGLCGGLSLLLSTGGAYVTDVTSPEKRTFRIIMVETALFVGLGIGQFSLGFALRYNTDQSLSKFILPLWIALGCAVVSLLYTTIPGLLIETINRGTAGKASKISEIFSGIYQLVQDNTNGRRAKLLGYTVIMVFTVLSAQSMSAIFVVYGLGQPLCLTTMEIAIFNVIALSSSTVGMIVGGAILPRFLSDNWILQISLLNAMLFSVLVGLADNKTMLYVAVSVIILKSLSFPVIRSQLSKLSAEHERGLMLAFIGCMDALAAFLCPIIVNPLYSATVFFYPPFVFFFLGGILIIPCIVTGALQCIDRKRTAYSKLEGDDVSHRD